MFIYWNISTKLTYRIDYKFTLDKNKTVWMCLSMNQFESKITFVGQRHTEVILMSRSISWIFQEIENISTFWESYRKASINREFDAARAHRIFLLNFKPHGPHTRFPLRKLSCKAESWLLRLSIILKSESISMDLIWGLIFMIIAHSSQAKGRVFMKPSFGWAERILND